MSRINTGVRLTQEKALERILVKCQERNLTFLGFNNEENRYTNSNVYLILKCNKCGHIWKTTNYTHFVNNKRTCPQCSKYRHFTDKERIDRIKAICKERNFEFIGYVNNLYEGPSTKLRLRCKKCGEEWATTMLSNFFKNDRNSHSCGRSNPTYSAIKGKVDINKIIKNVTQALEETSLEFVSFDGGYNGYAHTHILLRCSKCGKINRFSYHYFNATKKKVLCKGCEGGGKFSDEEARRTVQKKAEDLGYTFLGFDNKEDRYNGKNTYLILKCNKCGRVWKTTTFWNFKTNVIKCLGCSNSWKMPMEIAYALKREKINFIEECRTKYLPWLKHKASLSLDIYLPDYKIGIECQGRQHFEPVLDFGGGKTFLDSQERDKKKLDLCKANGVTLLYYDSENKHKEFLGEKVYNTQEEILNKIKELING